MANNTTVSLNLDNGRFNKNLKQSMKQLGEFESQIGNTSKSIESFLSDADKTFFSSFDKYLKDEIARIPEHSMELIPVEMKTLDVQRNVTQDDKLTGSITGPINDPYINKIVSATAYGEALKAIATGERAVTQITKEGGTNWLNMCADASDDLAASLVKVAKNRTSIGAWEDGLEGFSNLLKITTGVMKEGGTTWTNVSADIISSIAKATTKIAYAKDGAEVSSEVLKGMGAILKDIAGSLEKDGSKWVGVSSEMVNGIADIVTNVSKASTEVEVWSALLNGSSTLARELTGSLKEGGVKWVGVSADMTDSIAEMINKIVAADSLTDSWSEGIKGMAAVMTNLSTVTKEGGTKWMKSSAQMSTGVADAITKISAAETTTDKWAESLNGAVAILDGLSIATKEGGTKWVKSASSMTSAISKSVQEISAAEGTVNSLTAALKGTSAVMDGLSSATKEGGTKWLKTSSSIALGMATSIPKITEASTTVDTLSESMKGASEMMTLLTGVTKEGGTKWLNFSAGMIEGLAEIVPKVAEANGGVDIMAASLNGVSTVMGAVAGSTDDATAAYLNYAANSAAAASAAIPQIMALVTAKKSEAVASEASAITGAASSVASIPFVGWAMAVAAVAAMVAAFAAVPKFATGGIVGGSNFSGDKMLARLNSGEMILNRSQQSNMFDMINSGVTNQTNTPQTVVLSTRVRGKDIEIAGKNYNKIQRKLG